MQCNTYIVVQHGNRNYGVEFFGDVYVIGDHYPMYRKREKEDEIGIIGYLDEKLL